MEIDYSAFINTLNTAMNAWRIISDTRKADRQTESSETSELECENTSNLKTHAVQSAGKWNYTGHLIYNVDDPGKVVPNMKDVPDQVYQSALVDLAEVSSPGIPPSPFSGEVMVDGVAYYYETTITPRPTYPHWQTYILRVYTLVRNEHNEG